MLKYQNSLILLRRTGIAKWSGSVVMRNHLVKQSVANVGCWEGYKFCYLCMHHRHNYCLATMVLRVIGMLFRVTV